MMHRFRLKPATQRGQGLARLRLLTMKKKVSAKWLMQGVFLGHCPCGAQSSWGHPGLLTAGPWGILKRIHSLQGGINVLVSHVLSWEEANEEGR